ncbi:MAG: helix-turn-helix transcriptional regulator [Planctomycetales bacterium]|nr:helix-turn-helix transcriptional regulator [Planctomycetales bacterium]
MNPAAKGPDLSTYRGRCAARLRELRLKSGLTPEDVAHATGVTVTTVYHWERGHSEPKQNILPTLAQIFSLKSPRSVLAPS